MAASRLARGKCSFSPLLYRCGRLWGCPTARVVRHTPPPRLTPVVLYSSSPGIGGKAGRWVKRQVYTVLVLGGLSTGVLVMVCAAWLGNISQYLLQHSAPEQIMTPFLLLSFFCIDHLFSLMSPPFHLVLLPSQVYLGMKRQVEQLSWLEKYFPSSVGGRIADGMYIVYRADMG